MGKSVKFKKGDRVICTNSSYEQYNGPTNGVVYTVMDIDHRWIGIELPGFMRIPGMSEERAIEISNGSAEWFSGNFKLVEAGHKINNPLFAYEGIDHV